MGCRDVREPNKSSVTHKLTKGQVLLVFMLRVLVACLFFAAVHKKVEVEKNHYISTQLGDKKIIHKQLILFNISFQNNIY